MHVATYTFVRQHPGSCQSLHLAKRGSHFRSDTKQAALENEEKFKKKLITHNLCGKNSFIYFLKYC